MTAVFQATMVGSKMSMYHGRRGQLAKKVLNRSPGRKFVVLEENRKHRLTIRLSDAS